MLPQATQRLAHFASDGHCRQRSDEDPPVVAPDQSRVTDHHGAVVFLAADQPAYTLLESKCGFRQLIVLEGIAARRLQMIDAGLRYRVVRGGERQLLDD